MAPVTGEYPQQARAMFGRVMVAPGQDSRGPDYHSRHRAPHYHKWYRQRWVRLSRSPLSIIASMHRRMASSARPIDLSEDTMASALVMSFTALSDSTAQCDATQA